MEVDHIISISKGGNNRHNNLQLLCPSCNRKKNAKMKRRKRHVDKRDSFFTTNNLIVNRSYTDALFRNVFYITITVNYLYKMIQLYHMTKKTFVISFDIPSNLPNFKLQINRRLKRIGARLIQKSLWQHENLDELIKIAVNIKLVGGKARIMEERLIFE